MTVNFNLLQTLLKAQPWQQLGPGAGVQERAVCMCHNSAKSSYDLYMGSDVSGVWRASNFNIAATNPNPYLPPGILNPISTSCTSWPPLCGPKGGITNSHALTRLPV